jgi:S1-C subfamily serine protease
MADFFAVPGERGVLVSDVAKRAPPAEVACGDIITALDDQPVGSVGELTTRAGARTNADPVRLSVRRGRRSLHVRFSAE